MNALFVDFEKNQIIMTREFAQKCRNTLSEEYARLQSVRRDYPTFTVNTRAIKTNPNKESYKGLTYQYMEDYIATHETGEALKEVLHEYHELRLITQCHSKAFRYPVVKKWFLAKYPEIVTFGKIADPSPKSESTEANPQTNNVTDFPTAEAPAPEEKKAG